jgi:signal transduction histidine kinase/ActR/RegA family two-component response regulator
MRSLIERLRSRVDAAGHARLRVRLILFGVLAIVAFAASTAYDTWRSYHHAIVSTDGELQNLASALAEQTDWAWQSADLVLLEIGQWRQCVQYPSFCRLRTPPSADVASPEHTQEYLATVIARVPQVHSIRILDTHGILQYSSDDLARRGLDLSDRSYFRALKSGAARGLYVSEPLVTRSEGRTAVILARRLEDPEGRFTGVVGAAIDLEDLGRLYAAVNLRGNVTTQLLRDDGVLLARRPATPELVGRQFPVFSSITSGASARIVSPITGDRQFVAVAPVRSAPLLVAVGRNETAALAASRQEAVHGVVRTLFLAILGALTIAALLRQLDRVEQVAEALRQSQKMEAIGTLAGGIAHDFNNILGAIVGYGEFAQQQAPEGSALRRYLDNVMHAAGRARALVDRILGFSRSGLAEQVPVAIQRVVAETLELLGASLPPSIRLERELEAPDAALIGDETRLHQVTMNLCTNAAQAMPEGGVLHVRLEQLQLAARRTLSRGHLAAGSYVCLTIRDTGTGIPPEIAGRIFDPFFTTKAVGEGTGLGLAMVDGIILDLGGAIEVSSQVGEGTTFKIWLPTTDQKPRLVAAESVELPRGNGETVMIVDDERALVSLTEEMLAELGYEPVGFGSSAAALEAFHREPARFDVVLTDEMMPDVLGSELAGRVRALRPGVPVIIMTGYGGPQLTERAAAAGIAEVLRKPLQKREIAEALSRWLDATRQTHLPEGKALQP